jgi:pyridoxine 5'-phosphate synthase PdxJ
MSSKTGVVIRETSIGHGFVIMALFAGMEFLRN